jgi:hypothetical protein
MIIPLMMEAEMVSETLGFYPQLTRLVAREDFIVFLNSFTETEVHLKNMVVKP